MLPTLKEIFSTGTIETPDGTRKKLDSHTTEFQGLFLQKVFDDIKPSKSLEVGLALGISTMFILEKWKERNGKPKSHIVIEAYPEWWKGVAEHNIAKEGLIELADIYYKRSDLVLPVLYAKGERIQYAYIDTTKLFDIVLTDFYFIDKMLDFGGVVIFDDASTIGISQVVRFVSTLPHYKIIDAHGKVPYSFKRKAARKIVSGLMALIPFRSKFYPLRKLNLDYSCIVFQKIGNDTRNWDWGRMF